ncbi:MAG: NAD(P)-dependent oxidoreductase [Ardenticatenaceae bacterium]|nr:NAD(P)-dependent oxidoreductase [Ardenticatenaceae bacterium]HBY99126.1 NAD(P)-dependent oxidoreductase [Chloroflexota bacterium]
MRESISVIGLGLMGRPVARTLAASGWAVQGWNRSPLPVDVTEGITQCRNLADAAHAEVCLLMLADSDAVDEVLARLEPHLVAGQLVLDMGTSDPARSQVHASRLAEKGIGWVDAPVSGGPEGAASGTLAIMAGGRQDDFARVKPILDVLGGNVVHVGDAGMGHMVKVINQVIVGLTIEAVAEALTLAERMGLDPRLVQQALKGGWADSKILQHHGTRMIARDYQPGAHVKTQLKDLRLAQALADAAGVQLPHLNSTVEFYEALVAQGDVKRDHTALHKLLWSPPGR